VTDDVKRGSTNPGGRGQARTRLARRAVIDAARERFVAGGYTATTIDAISAHADVPQATVYRLFGSKLGILKALLDTSIAGDDRPVAVPDRAEVAALFSEPDPRALLAGFAAFTTTINERTADVYGVLVGAAATDPGAAELLAVIHRQRGEGQRRIARTLARAKALRAGIRERDAADIIHGLMSPDVYRLFVVDRAWKPARYRAWLTDTLVQQLL